jgi:bilirubin oxidase
MITKLTTSLAAFSLAYSVFAQNPVAIPPTLQGTEINLNLQLGTVNFKTGTPTNTMGVNGDLLGPTLILEKHQQVTINVTNSLGEPTTLHWHGMHVAPENDGGPHIIIMPGQTWSPSFEVLDWASTHWYHPHLHHHTNEHVLKGIAGFIISRDADEAAINLPRTYGVDDFPLVVQTKAFDDNNQIIVLSALDSNLMVNGTINPYLDAPAQVVRMRLLNGSSERYYNFGFEGNKTFYQLASDAGLLRETVALTRLMLAPGERAEILIDLAPFNGQSFNLMSFGSELANGIYGATQPGRGANQTIPNYTLNPLNGSDFNVMQINVMSPTSNPVLTIPTALVNHTPWLEADADGLRTFLFQPTGQGAANVLNEPFTINGALFDMDVINFETETERIEVWELTNQSPMDHPFHLHGFPFYVLDINGAAPPLNLQGRKDVINVPSGGGIVRFITKFENFSSEEYPYMYHCHMLTHEEDGMMGQFLVMPKCLISINNEPQDKSGVVGETIQFSVDVSPDSFSYRWQTDIGFGFQDLTNAGQYSGTNTNTLSVANITLTNNNQLFRCIIGEGFCSDTTNVVKLSVGQLSIKESNIVSTTLFPNPTKGSITIISNDEIQFIEIYDIYGKIIKSFNVDFKSSFTLNIESFRNAMYLMKVHTKSTLFSTKFIKE